jgi:D-alanyl-D-alanine carboxypeptidase
VNWKTVQSDADNWTNLMALKALKFMPGTQYDYNNNNTFMRRRLIENVSGKSFKDFVEQRLLTRAGVKNGIVNPSENTPMLAKPFDNNYKSYLLVPPISGWTCLDLAGFYQWSKAINSFRLISAASTLQMSTPFQAEAQAGLGNTKMQDGRITIHEHDGIAIRYQALIQYQASKDRTIILMTNQRQDNIYDLAGEINKILDMK